MVARLLATADGVPLHVEELLAAMADDGVLVRDGGRWTARGPADGHPSPPVPVSLVATLAGRVDRLGPGAVAVLRAAALLGRRFPARTAGAAADVDGPELVAGLREAVDAQLVVPQDDPEWYAFRHALTAEALAARLLPLERAALARRAAEAVEASGPAPFEGWEQVAGALWSQAGEGRRAAERFGAAGRRAAAEGAVSTGIALLERALSLAGRPPASPVLAADLGEVLVGLYADAGRIDDAYALGARLDVGASVGRRTAVHLRLARVAATAGHWRQGFHELAEVQRLVGPAPDPATGARIDAIEAELTFGDPGAADRRPAADRLARRALRAAEATGQPDVACSALETLGRGARLRDLAEAGALYERGLAVAEAHHLVAWRMLLLYHVGADDGIVAAEPGRLVEALTVAREAGAVATALDIELEVSVVRLCRGEFEEAAAATRRCEETAARLRLTHTRLVALGERILVAAHRGRRAEVDTLLARFHALDGDDDDFSSAVRGVGLAICHLLHEDREPARAELSRAVAEESRRPTSYLSLVHGPHLLLSVVDGRAGAPECAALAGSPQVQARWNRQFLVLAEAVLRGREGRRAEADRAVDRFLTLSRPYPLARSLGLRLVSPDAIRDGWGDPVSWLRTAEAHFHDDAPALARACRVLLRRAGAPVPQHRQGSASLPAAARERGVTVREYEVLGLVAERLGNRDIGRRLFLSPRTVEKHVANLLAKTGADDRGELVAFAAHAGVGVGPDAGTGVGAAVGACAGPDACSGDGDVDGDGPDACSGGGARRGASPGAQESG